MAKYDPANDLLPTISAPKIKTVAPRTPDPRQVATPTPSNPVPAAPKAVTTAAMPASIATTSTPASRVPAEVLLAKQTPAPVDPMPDRVGGPSVAEVKAAKAQTASQPQQWEVPPLTDATGRVVRAGVPKATTTPAPAAPVPAPTPAPTPPVSAVPEPAPVILPAVMPPPASTPAADTPATNAPVTDPNALDRYITPENTLRGQRIGFDVNPGSLRESLDELIRTQLPALDMEFADNVEQLAKRTAAMGRTGSGMFDREFGELSDRARAQRDALFGRLAYDATQRDLNANMETDLARLAHLIGERGYDDRLARDAMEDEANRLRFLSTAFDGNPNAMDNALVATLLAGAGQFGSNAGQINAQLGDAAGPVISALLRRIFGGGSGGADVSEPILSAGGLA